MSAWQRPGNNPPVLRSDSAHRDDRRGRCGGVEKAWGQRVPAVPAGPRRNKVRCGVCEMFLARLL